MRFAVRTIEQVQLAGPEQLLCGDLMSPYVWRTCSGTLSLLVRAVPPSSEGGAITGRVWYGVGESDGRRFTMDTKPLLTPGPDDLDSRGCEDPTFVHAKDSCVVYYTGLVPRDSARCSMRAGRIFMRWRKRA